MNHLKVVIDTNVLIAALRSPNGASFQVLRLIGRGYFETCVSVPLVLEYEGVAKRNLLNLPISAKDVDTVIDFICQVSQQYEIYYTWRPLLQDPNDEMVLELAVGSGSNAIVTFNKRDFAGIERFGIGLLTPAELLHEIGLLI